MEMPKIQTTVVQLGPELYAIDQVMVRSFLILGQKEALLLDTGAVDEDLPALVAGITKLPVTLCMSHGDGDHTGALGRFAKAYAHPADFRLLQEREPRPATELLPVEEGHVFDLGGKGLEVIHIPGHTDGSIALLNRETGELFSGDTVSYGPVFMFGARRNMELFKASLNKLGAMADKITTIYPCHNTCPIGTDCIQELLDCVKGIQDGTLAPGGGFDRLPPGSENVQCYTVGNSGILF